MLLSLLELRVSLGMVCLYLYPFLVKRARAVARTMHEQLVFGASGFIPIFFYFLLLLYFTGYGTVYISVNPYVLGTNIWSFKLLALVSDNTFTLWRGRSDY